MSVYQQRVEFVCSNQRPLKLFPFDPMLGRREGSITVVVKSERLTSDPKGSRIEVIDYDGENHRFHPQVDLDDRAILMKGGIDPSESDPRFHQQMVYAEAMKTLENFDRAPRRSMELRKNKEQPLRLLPYMFFCCFVRTPTVNCHGRDRSFLHTLCRSHDGRDCEN